MRDAIATAGDEGMVVVAAAGNDGLDTDASPFFPADFDLPNEISVAAIDATGALATFSNYGANTVDLAAPGTGIETTLDDGTYGVVSGTSVATPFVTGTVALVASLHPNWTAAELVRQVLATAAPSAARSSPARRGIHRRGRSMPPRPSGPAAIATTPTIAWPTPPTSFTGRRLGPSQLDATASALGASVAGTFTYSPPLGTVLHAGGGQTLSVTFTPDDTTDYNPATASVLINVAKATPVINWPSPAGITYGMPLGPAQLDATATYPGGTVAGTLHVFASVGARVLHAGPNQALLAIFTPADTADFVAWPSPPTSINVTKATPVINWPPLAGITYGTPLGPNQLDATSAVPGTITYSAAAGAVLGAGQQSLTATLTPTDPNDYNTVSHPRKTALNVAKAHLLVLAGNNVTIYGQPRCPR